MDQLPPLEAPQYYSHQEVMEPEFRLEIAQESRRLLMQTFRRAPDADDRWVSRPPEQWMRLAEFSSGWLLLRPVFANPHAKRYLTPMHAPMLEIYVELDRPYDLPEDGDAAHRQLERHLRSKVFEMDVYGVASLSSELAEMWRMMGRYAETLMVTRDGPPSIDETGRGFVSVSEPDLNTLRKAMNRVEARLRERIRLSKRGILFQNFLARLFPDRIFVEQTDASAATPDLPAAQRASPTQAQREIGHASVSALRNNLAMVAADSPATLIQLRSEIERVTLIEMIRRFDQLLSGSHREARWQKFFEGNAFVLTLAFARPVRLLHSQFRAQPASMAGSGAQIGDLLLRELGQGLVVVEIKRPDTDLLSARPYRNAEVFGPSAELGGAINQVLHQQAALRMNWLAHFSGNPAIRESMPDALKCMVIAGRRPSTGTAELRSFEILRSGYKDVEIITFDELGDKLRLVLSLLNAGEPQSGTALTNAIDV